MTDSRERRLDASALVALAAISLASSVLINAGVVCSNDGSQYALIRALVDDGTASIDARLEYTREVDFAEREGHYYSDRPPGTAFLAIPIYAAARAAGLDDVGRQTAVAFLAHVAGALAVLGLFLLARRVGASRVGASAAAIALALATPHRSYSATLFAHALSAALVIAVAHAVLPGVAASPRRRRLVQLLGGIAGGYACGVDYTNGLPVAVLCIAGAIAESVRERRLDVRALATSGGVYLAGGLLGVAPTLAYHTIVFGSPLAIPYHFDVRFTYAHSVGGMYSGRFWDGFFGLMFSPRAGLVVWSPILVAALASIPLLARRAGGRAWVIVLPWIALYLVTSKNLTWDAGATQDVRYLTSVLPLVCLPLAFAFDWAFGRTPDDEGPARPLAASALVVLLFVSALIQIAKHNALWARDGGRWIHHLASALERDAGPTLTGFAAWAYPHPIAAGLVLAAGLALAAALRLSAERA